MNHINQLMKFSNNELKGLHILDEETIKKLMKQKNLYIFLIEILDFYNVYWIIMNLFNWN